jgi:peptide/nickel transport system substrate-binding protein
VTFKVGTPYTPLAYAFANSFPGSMTGIVCPAGLKPGADLATKMYGAGPYTLVSAAHGVGVTFKLRKNFTWGPNGATAKTPGVAQTVVYKIVTNPTTMSNLLLTGGLNVGGVEGVSGAETKLLSTTSLQHTAGVAYVLNALTFNATPGHPTDDVALRHALITAVSPAVWHTTVDQGRSVTSSSVFPPNVECYDAATAQLAPKTSIAAAKQILAAGGYKLSGGTLTKGGKPVTIHLVLTNLYDPGPEYIQQQWTQLGIKVDLTDTDYLDWVTALLKGNFDSSMVTTDSPGPIPGPSAQRMVGPSPAAGGTNYAWTDDAALNADVAAGLKTTSCAPWTAFQTQLWKNWNLLPLTEPYTYTFGNKASLTLGTEPIFVRALKS